MGDREARYAGLVVFTASLFSLLTGLLFSVIVARRISTEEYGILQFYSTAITYFVLPGTVIGYWLTRDLGRGRQLLMTGIMMNSLLGFFTSLSLWLVSVRFGGPVKLTTNELVAVVANLYLLYLSSTLDAASIGVVPVLQGEGLIVQEVVKIGAGWILIVLLRMELLGVLLSIDAGFLCKFVFMYLRMPSDARGRLDLSVAARWLKRGWVPFLVILPGLIGSADLLMFPLVAASTVPAAYLGLSKTLAAIILYANSLAITLYPKLLRGRGRTEIEDAFRIVMMVAVPMAAGMLSLALPITQLFGQNYAPAVAALQLLTIAAFFNVIKGLSLTILQGKEGVDVDPDRSLGDLLRSNLVVPRLLEILVQLAYVLVSLVLTSYMWWNGSPPELMVTTLAFVNLSMTIPLSLWMWKLSTKICAYSIPWTDFASYVVSAVVMATVVMAAYPAEMVAVTVYEMGLHLLFVVALGALVYFTTLLVINRRLRIELHSVFRSKLKL